MGQNPSETGPIAEESASLKHLGYALELVSKLLDMMGFPEDYHDRETVMTDDLVNLQHHLVNAKHGAKTQTPTVESVAAILEDLYAVKIDEVGPCECDCHESNWPSPSGEHGPCWCDCNDGSCEGEMQAEAEAERQADAALELSAELASCDWESWY